MSNSKYNPMYKVWAKRFWTQVGQYWYIKSNTFGVHALGSATLPLLEASLELVSCPAKHMTKLETRGYPEIFSPLTGFSSLAKGRRYKSDKRGWGGTTATLFLVKNCWTHKAMAVGMLSWCRSQCVTYLDVYSWYPPPNASYIINTCHISSWMTCTFSLFLSDLLKGNLNLQMFQLKFSHFWIVNTAERSVFNLWHHHEMLF